MVRQRNPTLIDEELFDEYLRHVFIPYLATLRPVEAFSSELAIGLMDTSRPHISERCLPLLHESRVLALFFPAHTTNIFQTSDLAFFGASKKLNTNANGEFNDNSVKMRLPN
jgi:hypothetical protein